MNNQCLSTPSDSKIAKITRRGDEYFVETTTGMSDGSTQHGWCKLDREARQLRFPGELNRLPFVVKLGLVSYAILLDLRDGEFYIPCK
jgi:hypothetical protein